MQSKLSTDFRSRKLLKADDSFIQFSFEALCSPLNDLRKLVHWRIQRLISICVMMRKWIPLAGENYYSFVGFVSERWNRLTLKRLAGRHVAAKIYKFRLAEFIRQLSSYSEREKHRECARVIGRCRQSQFNHESSSRCTKSQWAAMKKWFLIKTLNCLPHESIWLWRREASQQCERNELLSRSV
jgi:hypothetical protein